MTVTTRRIQLAATEADLQVLLPRLCPGRSSYDWMLRSVFGVDTSTVGQVDFLEEFRGANSEVISQAEQRGQRHVHFTSFDASITCPFDARALRKAFLREAISLSQASDRGAQPSLRFFVHGVG